MIVSVNSTLPAKQGCVWWMVDLPEIGSFEALHEILTRDGCFRGIKLEGSIYERRELHVLRRIPIIVSLQGVASITPPHLAIFDERGVQLGMAA